MTTILIALLTAFVAAMIATRIVAAIALRLAIVDKPDGFRKLHRAPTPQLGGVAIFVAIVTTMGLLLLFRQRSQVVMRLVVLEPKLLGLFMGATMALVMGVADDVFDLKPRWKIVWQILIATTAYAFGLAINAISVPFGGYLSFGLLAYPATVLWFVGCMNAVNLLDGLDGLAAGACLFVTLTLLLVSLYFENFTAAVIMGIVSGGIPGFLMFNFPPAKIFLGDSGSMLLGFMIAALSLVGA